MSEATRHRSGYRAALRSRDLRLLLGAEVISSTGGWAYSVALTVFLFDRTHSPSWVAIGVLAKFVPSLVFSPYGGIVAERFERIRLMIGVNCTSLVLQAAMALLMWKGGPVGMAVVLASVTSILRTAYLPAVAAVIPQLVGEDDLAAANALSGTVDNLVVVLGPAVGAGLVALGGSALAVLANAVSFGVGAVLLSRMAARSHPSDVTDGGRAGPLQQVAQGFRTVASSATVGLLVSFSVVASFVYGTDTVLFVPLAITQFHSGSKGYGYLLAGLGVGGVLGATLVNRLAARPRLAAALMGGMAVYTLPTALMVFVHQAPVGVALQVVRGAGTVVVDTLAITALQRSVPREMVARVFGVFFALALGAMSLGALITPYVLRAGLHTTLIAYGVGVPALCLVALPRLLSLDRVAAARALVLAPRVALFERMGLFAAASRPALESIAASASEVDVPAGTPVVVEGDPADAFYAIVNGTLEVTAVGERGVQPSLLRTLEPGEYFGEIGLIGRVRRTATVTATTGCTLLRVPGDDFLQALTSLSASSSLVEGARTRLSATHPSSHALDDVDTSSTAVPAATVAPAESESSTNGL